MLKLELIQSDFVKHALLFSLGVCIKVIFHDTEQVILSYSKQMELLKDSEDYYIFPLLFLVA